MTPHIHPSPVTPITASELQEIHARTIGDYEPEGPPEFDGLTNTVFGSVRGEGEAWWGSK